MLLYFFRKLNFREEKIIAINIYYTLNHLKNNYAEKLVMKLLIFTFIRKKISNKTDNKKNAF